MIAFLALDLHLDLVPVIPRLHMLLQLIAPHYDATAFHFSVSHHALKCPELNVAFHCVHFDIYVSGLYIPSFC